MDKHHNMIYDKLYNNNNIFKYIYLHLNLFLIDFNANYKKVHCFSYTYKHVVSNI